MAECAKSLMNFTKNYKVFWRTRTLKPQIFKKLKGIFWGTLHFTVPEYYVNSHTPSRKTFSDFFAMAMNTKENNLVYDDIYKTTTDKYYLHPNKFSIKGRDYFSFFYNMF